METRRATIEPGDLPQRIFAEFVQRIKGMEAYHADLYHDAQRLAKLCADEPAALSLLWAVRKTGTELAQTTEENEMRWWRASMRSMSGGWLRGLRIKAGMGGERYWLEIEEVSGDALNKGEIC